MRRGMMHPRIWLWACMWCLIVWTAPARASWEAYQQAGEAAYSRGDYGTAQRMFLAAVREARYFGPQDPRLDISLNKLALLREARGAPGKGRGHTQRFAGRKARKTSVARRGRQRPPSYGAPACQVGTSTTCPAPSATWRASQGYTDQHRAPGTSHQTATRPAPQGQTHTSCGPPGAPWQAAGKPTAELPPAGAAVHKTTGGTPSASPSWARGPTSASQQAT